MNNYNKDNEYLKVGDFTKIWNGSKAWERTYVNQSGIKLDLDKNTKELKEIIDRNEVFKLGEFKVEDKEVEIKDSINPSHYGAGNGIECIDAMLQQFGKEEVKSFCKLNAFKYLFRCGHKNAPLEEMKKVQWYVNKWIELESKKED